MNISSQTTYLILDSTVIYAASKINLAFYGVSISFHQKILIDSIHHLLIPIVANKLHYMLEHQYIY